jgi:glycosyltransferase involved in cell wall biosynthesis
MPLDAEVAVPPRQADGIDQVPFAPALHDDASIRRGRAVTDGADTNRVWPGAPAPRIAIVHEWLESYAGSERVLEQLLICFPQADVFAVVDFVPKSQRHFLQGRKVHTSFIQRMPLSRRMFRNYLGLMPLAIQQLDLSGYDLVFSSNHAVAKGVLTGPAQIHISYVHSPMRYAWDLQHQYLAQSGMDRGIRGAYVRWLLTRLRQWDVCSSQGVDHFIANSSYIADRIVKTYRRRATVIHPPVDIDRFSPVDEKSDYFLLACRFVPYKRADIVVESFARNRSRRLIVVGDGPDRKRVHAVARNAPNIEFRGTVSQPELIQLMQKARAFVFAAEEDFGIAMVEAQACGTPVIAFGRGGARDIIVSPDEPNPTGLLFSRQDPDAVSTAIDEFERFGPLIASTACRANAVRFSQDRFRRQIRSFVAELPEIKGSPFAAAHAPPRGDW